MRCASGSSLASAPINTSCALVRQERSFTGDDVGKTANPPTAFQPSSNSILGGLSYPRCKFSYRTGVRLSNRPSDAKRYCGEGPGLRGFPTGAYVWLHEEREHRLSGRKQDRQRG